MLLVVCTVQRRDNERIKELETRVDDMQAKVCMVLILCSVYIVYSLSGFTEFCNFL